MTMKKVIDRNARSDSPLCTEAQTTWPERKSSAKRNEVEDHAEAGGVQGDAAEQVTGAGQRHEGVDQSDEVAPQRETQPKQMT